MAANIKTKGATLRAAPSLRRGTKQIRTAVAGFADLCLTARPWYRVLITSAKVLLFLEPTRVDRVFLSFALHFVPVESPTSAKLSNPFVARCFWCFKLLFLSGAMFFAVHSHLLVYPTPAVPPPTTRSLFRKCTCLPPQPPTRTRCFSFFAFTWSLAYTRT